VFFDGPLKYSSQLAAREADLAYVFAMICGKDNTGCAIRFSARRG